MKTTVFINFWKGVWIFLNSRIFVIILVVGLIIFGFTSYQNHQKLKQQAFEDTQNISALSDSISTIYNVHNGEVTAIKDSFISNEKNLKDLNKGLSDKVSEQSGEILSLTTTIIEMKQDSMELANTIDAQNVKLGEFEKIGLNKYTTTWSIPHVYDSLNFFTVDGRTTVRVASNPFRLLHDTTYLTSFTNRIHLTYGQKFENGRLRVFVQSKYPGFTVKSMEGVLIDPNDWPSVFRPEKRHWFTGFGIGPNISVDRNGGVMFGIGIHYNIYEW